MILHSELTNQIILLWDHNGITDGAKDDLIKMTRGGVWPELITDGFTLKYKAPPPLVPPAPSLGKMMDMASAPHPTLVGSGFKFGTKSESELAGVHPLLVSTVRKALEVSRQDFMVFDGLRTIEEQKSYVAKGTSQTMHSMHMAQPDGYGHATDLVPVVGVIPKWDWDLIYPVCTAMLQAALALGTADKIVWGGAWDRRLSDLADMNNPGKSVIEYCSRHEGKDFIDGPHFEIRV